MQVLDLYAICLNSMAHSYLARCHGFSILVGCGSLSCSLVFVVQCLLMLSSLLETASTYEQNQNR